MSARFIVLVPARMTSTRLPGKPLADIAGLPMVVRVVRQAARSAAARVVVAADHADIARACEAHAVDCVLTREDHASGSDRLAEACHLIGLPDTDVVVNVQGDEPLIAPAMIDACAALLATHADCAVGTVAHAIDDMADYVNPNVVKVVCDAAGRAAYFSRAPVPWRRDGATRIADFGDTPPLRHVGLYAYRVGYLKRFPTLSPSPLEQLESLEQLRVLWHGDRIAVHVSAERPGPGVDTPADLERVRALLA